MTRHLLMMLVMLTMLPAFAADWPRFFGPNANGISPETGIAKDWGAHPPRERWRVALTDDGYAAPAVADGKVFIVDHEKVDGKFTNRDIVRALDFNTGKEVWQFAYEDTHRHDYGFYRSTPAYDQGRLYTLSRMGWLICFNAKTGEPLWHRNIIADFRGQLPGWQMSISPFIDGEKLIICPGGESAAVVALNKVNGEVIWHSGPKGVPGYATPVAATINGVQQYVIFAGEQLMGFAAQDGAPLWSVPWKTAHNVNAAMPLVIGNTVFITSNYGRGCGLVQVNGNQAAILWEKKDIQSHFSSPILYQGNIYSTSDPGFLVCMNPADGSVRWKQRGFEKGALVAVDGVMLVLDGANGDLAMVKLSPESYQELGRIKPLGGQSWTAPIVANGHVLVRNRSALVCLSLK
jgi:outer membrane protein assembly factor BamB